MSLKDIHLKLSYNSGENNIIEEFYIPCLKNSIKYDRAVGFFTSEILIAISCGLETFVTNKGLVRIVCSPKLSEEDVEAIEKGYGERDAIIYNALLKEINRIPDDISDNSLNFLSWLIANNKLDIKIALIQNISRETYGIYHEKIGIFYDEEGNAVSFSGSHNETLYGVAYNYESFDVYKSWLDQDRCNIKISHFNNLWDGISYGVKTYRFPEALKNKIIEKLPPQEAGKIKSHFSSLKVFKKENSPEVFLKNLWYFQKEAIESWNRNDFKGILSMATGTGKTKTAIGGIVELLKSKQELFAVVTCPQNTIIKQWEKDIEEIGIFKYSLIADSTNSRWPNEMSDKIIDYNDGYINNCVIYTTYNTLSSDAFIRILNKLKKTSLLVCDEVHWSGADTFREGLLPLFNYRLGLSATPVRYMDEEGTDEIKNYFGNVVYEFPLERALKEINPITQKTFLSPYLYYPKFVSLNETELIEYNDLSKKIKRQFMKESKREKLSEYFQRLCEKRQAIIVNVDAKYEMLRQLIDFLEPVKYLLVYCSPEQIDNVQDLLNKRGVVNHRFTGEEGTVPREEYNYKSERDYILTKFESGDYKALVAILPCLLNIASII